jgi:putative SOS response-associated peptidase YedK
MCGRVVTSSPVDLLAAHFGADLAGEPESYEHGYNMAPTRILPGLVVDKAGDRLLDGFRWGLIPSWADSPAAGARLFNARAETITTSGAFKGAFATKRTAVIVDGFYEWQKRPTGKPQPYLFRRADGEPMVFAGLWAVWRDRGIDGAPWIRSCTIVTTGASSDIDDIHDRMPVVLEEGAIDVWIDPERHDTEWMTSLLVPAPPGTLARHPVGRAVGDVRNDSPDLTDPVEPAETAETAEQPRLF